MSSLLPTIRKNTPPSVGIPNGSEASALSSHHSPSEAFSESYVPPKSGDKSMETTITQFTSSGSKLVEPSAISNFTTTDTVNSNTYANKSNSSAVASDISQFPSFNTSAVRDPYVNDSLIQTSSPPKSKPRPRPRP